MNIIRKALCPLLLILLGTTESLAQFNPQNPNEPAIKYQITVCCNPAEVAEMYMGGDYDIGASVYIWTYPKNGSYKFLYWECNGVVYNHSSSFYYTVEDHDVKFVAHYEYEPENPSEPNSVLRRRVFLSSQPEEIVQFNYNSGEKQDIGSTLWICESNRTPGYVFKGWYEGDKLISSSTGFYFTVPDRTVYLVALYEYDPSNPEEPNGVVIQSNVSSDIDFYDLLGREVDPQSVKEGPYIVREYQNGILKKTYKVIR